MRRPAWWCAKRLWLRDAVATRAARGHREGVIVKLRANGTIVGARATAHLGFNGRGAYPGVPLGVPRRSELATVSR
jgi:hypothetical protein